MTTRRPRPAPLPRSAFAGFRFPSDVIVAAVRWYLRFGLSYRDIQEQVAERGVQVDHVTIYRWAQRFTPLLAEAARPCRHAVGDRWFVDETYVRVAGRWRYVYRVVDQFGQVIDVLVAARRDAGAAHRFFERALGATKIAPVEVVTDQAPVYPGVLEELLPAAWHRTDQYANNRVEGDHGRLKARLRPMPGLKQERSARVIIAGHAFVQNVRRGHYELAVDEPASRQVVVVRRVGHGDLIQGPGHDLKHAGAAATQQRLLGFLTRTAMDAQDGPGALTLPGPPDPPIGGSVSRARRQTEETGGVVVEDVAPLGD